jgi:Zn-dependent M28 family amino/carboxypeptidase
MKPSFQLLQEQVREEDLRRWVLEFSGLRHGQLNPDALEEKGERLLEQLQTFGLSPRREPFRYRGRSFFNVVAEREGREDGRPAFLVGAHYDGMMGTPGADDNASGVAALLAVAQVLGRIEPAGTIELVGFTLEEPQGATDGRFRHGSRHFAKQARRGRKRYDGVFILESVGYTDPRFGSQRVPLRVAISAPDAGTFLCVAGCRRSRALMGRFGEAAKTHVPDLSSIYYEAPLRGWILPMIRWSDHAPFWDRGYPALMLTDTAPLRNPHYHQPTDTPETLDYVFLTNVTRALLAAVLSLAG